MKCRRIQQFLPDYIGDELSTQKRRQVDQHLAECPGCRADLKAVQEVWDGLAQQPRPHKDERFWSELTKDVMTEIKSKGTMHEDKKRAFLVPGWRVLLPATAAAIAIIVGVIAMRGGLWEPPGRGPWIVQGDGDQKALDKAAPDLSFGPLAMEAEDQLEQEMTLQEVSLVAEALNTSFQPEEQMTITDVLTQLFNGEDLYGQLQGLTEGDLEELYQLLSAQYPYS
jgi:hypothetical protein